MTSVSAHRPTRRQAARGRGRQARERASYRLPLYAMISGYGPAKAGPHQNSAALKPAPTGTRLPELGSPVLDESDPVPWRPEGPDDDETLAVGGVEQWEGKRAVFEREERPWCIGREGRPGADRRDHQRRSLIEEDLAPLRVPLRPDTAGE